MLPGFPITKQKFIFSPVPKPRGGGGYATQVTFL